MFKLAVSWGYRPDDPSLGIERFDEHARERVLTDAELSRLMDALDASPSQVSANVIRLLLYTGSRPAEVLGATWEQFDLDAGVWIKPSQHTKTKRPHRVELGPDALEVLRGMEDARDTSAPWLFPSSSKAGHLTTVKTFWKLLCRRAGLEGIQRYDIRRTVLTRLMGQGTDLRTVMGVSGHTQPTTLLKHYAHAMPGKQREAMGKLFQSKVE
jgi:integrase